MKFGFKKTLIRNIGLLVRSTFKIILFIIGLNTIADSQDQTTTLFLCLIWLYIFLVNFKFNPRLIFDTKNGEVEEC